MFSDYWINYFLDLIELPFCISYFSLEAALCFLFGHDYYRGVALDPARLDQITDVYYLENNEWTVLSYLRIKCIYTLHIEHIFTLYSKR